ncbi:FAD/NAD(P)-binding domain-containing protein [Cubamyces sp. BRFM 1775]|nr:FAD/NAD(P)-binding domain-containing protein [Cubamyces sp. BRFM 1775]
MFTNLLAAAVLAFATSTHGALFTDPALLPPGKTYAYVIVGSGPGGSTVAARLSEDPTVNVLVIEAGPTGKDALEIEVPALAPSIQTGSPPLSPALLSGQKWMFWVRCPRDDYDKIANITGDDGWSWNFNVAILGKERLVSPIDGHDTTGQVDPAIHGTQGAINITVPNSRFPTDGPIINAAQEIGGDFQLIEDYNSGDPLGLGMRLRYAETWLQGANGNGIRNDAATAYLAPALSRPNLDVLVETQVTKVIQTGTNGSKPMFRGVEFAQSRLFTRGPAYACFAAARYVMNATEEVVLAAGSINTPQLLMLSGIGPSSQLSLLGIPTIVDLRDVGQHLADQPVITMTYNAKNRTDDVIANLARNETYLYESIHEWETRRRGVMTNAANNQLAFFRLPSNDSIFESP